MLTRNLQKEVSEALADSPVVYVRGARQVGKSTLVQAVQEAGFPAQYVSLDDGTILGAARSDPTGFIQSLPTPVILDEVQRAPDVLLAVKQVVDRKRRPGAFLLTGSANILSLPQVHDSLAGRIEVLTLQPFSQGELRGRRERFIDGLFQGECRLPDFPACTAADLDGMMVTGGYPELIVRKSPKRRAAWFGSYLGAIIERDIRDIARIKESADMVRLMQLLAARTSSLLNQSELSRTSQIPNATLGRYLEMLRSVFLMHELPAWAANLGKRLSKSPKVYLVDSGLAAYLAGLDEQGLQRSPEFAGQLLETFVVNEVLKQLGWSEVRARAYHFRSHTGQEVDMVLETLSGDVVGIEVKRAATLSPSDFKGLKVFRELLGDRFRAGVVLHPGGRVVGFGDRLFAAPVGCLWG